MASELSRAAGAQRWLLLPLHGELPASEQRRVFAPAPRGMRKVVLATNVAETSLTIDDITVVIDSGRVKQARYDAATHAGELVETWAPLSSRRQRRGRAGRTRRGQYWALYTRAQMGRLAAAAPPELLRSPLEGLCLQIKSLDLDGGDCAAFSPALDPPAAASVDAALGACAPPARSTPRAVSAPSVATWRVYRSSQRLGKCSC